MNIMFAIVSKILFSVFLFSVWFVFEMSKKYIGIEPSFSKNSKRFITILIITFMLVSTISSIMTYGYRVEAKPYVMKSEYVPTHSDIKVGEKLIDYEDKRGLSKKELENNPVK